MTAPGTFVTPSIELRRRIGAGGMGTVWIAFHRGLRKDVAVKLMAESIISSDELRARFAQEAVAGANVKSPHVVQVFDTGASEELGPYIVMELLEGEDLGSRLGRDDVLPFALVTRVVRQAAHALDRAHAIGIVHRDIKPANIFLCVEESAPFLTKVLDFGVATLRRESTQRTATGVSVGTPSYMSPEQASAKGDIDGKSDLYSLGLVAFRALTGSSAFPRESIEALGLGVYNMPPPKLTERRSSLPAAVDAWFARACARERDERFPDGATMAAELERALGVTVEEADELGEAPTELDDAPRSEGPTRAHVPEPPPMNTESGLAQKTDVPAAPPRKIRVPLFAAAALAAIAIGGFALHRARDGGSHESHEPVVAPAVVDAGPRPIPIGVLLDLSGERRRNGQRLLAASVAAEQLVNRSGGVRGRPIRLVVKDDQGDTGTFLGDATRALLATEGVRVVVGPMTSPQVELVSPLTQRAGVLEITGSAMSPQLTTSQRADERLLFRTAPSQNLQAPALARVMRNGTPKCTTAAVIATDDVSGRPFVEVFSRAFTSNGGRVVETRLVAAEDQASYATEIQAISRSKADCQVLVFGPKAAARYLREAMATPDVRRPAPFGVSNLAISDFIDYARANQYEKSSPSIAEGVRGVRPATNLSWRPEYIELEHLLSTSDAGEDVHDAPFVASQFDATVLAALTLEAAGPDAPPAQLRSHLREISRGGRVYGPHELPQLLAAIRRGEKVDYVGASGDVDMDENGDVESDLVSWVVKDGEVVDTGRVPK